MAGSLRKASSSRLHRLAVHGNFASVRRPFHCAQPIANSFSSIVMRTLVRTVLLLALARSAGAQRAGTGRIEGTIVDSLHSAPLAGARVSVMRLGAVSETTFVATADEEGRF